jgi:hypothetical protein
MLLDMQTQQPQPQPPQQPPQPPQQPQQQQKEEERIQNYVQKPPSPFKVSNEVHPTNGKLTIEKPSSSTPLASEWMQRQPMQSATAKETVARAVGSSDTDDDVDIDNEDKLDALNSPPRSPPLSESQLIDFPPSQALED